MPPISIHWHNGVKKKKTTVRNARDDSLTHMESSFGNAFRGDEFTRSMFHLLITDKRSVKALKNPFDFEDFDFRRLHKSGPLKLPETKSPLVDFTIVLPPEVATHVFSFIDTKTLLQSCSLVSKRWNALIDDPYVWQNRFQTEFGPWKYKPGNDWKKMARAYKEINGRWDGRKDPVNRKNDPAVSYFSGHRDNVYCVQFDE